MPITNFLMGWEEILPTELNTYCFSFELLSMFLLMVKVLFRILEDRSIMT